MAGKTEELTLTVDSNIGAISKEVEGLTEDIKIFGFGLTDMKKLFQRATASAKTLFGSIKAGIISTGVGALVLAFGTLFTWFKKTKVGAEALEVIFSGVGAAINVIVDRIARFGGGIAKILDGNVMDGLKDMGKSFLGIGKEIKLDTLATMALTASLQDLVDAERGVRVETAKRRAEIERLKLIAEDLTKSEAVRLKAAEDAFKIENDLLDKRVKNAKLAVTLETDRHRTIVPLAEDLDKLADLEVALFDIQAESTTKQIELNNKINSIKNEQAAKDAQRLQDTKDADNEKFGEMEKMGKREIELKDQIALADDTMFQNGIKNRKADARITKEMNDLKLQSMMGFAGAVNRLAGENKAVSAGMALINTYLAVTEVMKDATIPSTALKFITAGTVLANGLANVRTILSTDVGGGGGGGMSGTAVSGSPAPQMTSGAFDLSGVDAPEPIQAYVVTDSMTASQNKLQTIRRRSTI